MLIITVASSGVGLHIAKLYQDAGIRVVNISRRPSEYADVNISVSLAEQSGIDQAIAEIVNIDEPITALINVAGMWSAQELRDLEYDEIKRVMAINSDGLMYLTAQLHDRIMQDGADILNVISFAGTVGSKGFALYSASKWAQRGFTKSLQDLYVNTPTRVVSFCPGGMNTELFAKAGNTDLDTSNWMQPEDIAGLIKYILDLPKNIEVREIVLQKKS